jgi:hypothetical protein
MKKILTNNLIYEKMREDGIEEEMSNVKARRHMLNEWDAFLNTDSNSAIGHEELTIYTETSADGYSVYICTDNCHGNININNDLYYYIDGYEFMHQALDTLRWGGEVWIEPSIAEDIEGEIDIAFEIAYQEWHEKKFEEYKNELKNDGYESRENQGTTKMV